MQFSRFYLAFFFSSSNELFIIKAEKYNVVSLRNKKETVWNKKPLSKKEADEMAKDLAKSTISSVDKKSIEIRKADKGE